MIDVFKPALGAEELAQVEHSFLSGWIGKGQKVRAFEEAWAAHIKAGADQVVSCSCATEGLFQICAMLLEPGDEVIIPSIHFIGAANAILSAGAKPVYCDVDSASLNPWLEHIEGVRTERTAAVILLHYGGVAEELFEIRQWCDSNDLWMIEDAACAQATVHLGHAAGTWGHFGVWSFDAMKVMSTGDGGMIYCQEPSHARRLHSRLYLGMDTESGRSSQADRWWEFNTTNPGRRAILNDIAAGIGLVQLQKLAGFVERRRQIVDLYDKALEGLVQIPTSPDVDRDHNPYYFYWIQTPDRDALAQHLRRHEIYTTFRYYPLHWVARDNKTLPGAEFAALHTLLLPLHQSLGLDEVGHVIKQIKEFYR